MDTAMVMLKAMAGVGDSFHHSKKTFIMQDVIGFERHIFYVDFRLRFHEKTYAASTLDTTEQNASNNPMCANFHIQCLPMRDFDMFS